MSSEESYEETEYCEDDDHDHDQDDDDDDDDEYEEYEEIEEESYDDEGLTNEQQLPPSERNLRIHQTSITGAISSEIAELIIKAEENKAKNGLIAGLICIVLGVALTIIGATGFIDWSFAFGGINSTLTNAAPGVLLMIIGLLIIAVTNYNVTIK